MYIYFSPRSHHIRLVWEIRRYSQERNVRDQQGRVMRKGDSVEKGITIGGLARSRKGYGRERGKEKERDKNEKKRKSEKERAGERGGL